MSRVVFFENITHAHRPVVAWCIARGYRVYVFDFTYRLKSMAWLRKLFHEGRMERIYAHPSSRAEGLAIDAAEWFYPRVSDHPLIQGLGRIVGGSEAEPAFRYALVQSLFRYFYARLFLERYVETQDPASTVTFVPESFCLWDGLLRDWCSDRLKPLGGVCIPRWARLVGGGVRGYAKIRRQAPRYAASALYLMAGRLGGVLGVEGQADERGGYRCVYAIESGFQTKFQGGRRFDFLLDHRRLTKDNAAFLVGEAGEGPWTEQARQAGYRLIRRADYASLRGVLRHPPRQIPFGTALEALIAGVRHLSAPEWLHEAAVAGLLVILREANLFERVRFTHYVYMNQYGLIPRWRNVLVRRAGAQSWWLAYSNGGGFLYREAGEFAGGADFGGRSRYWAYENADHFVSPCRELIEYYQQHQQRVGRYHDVGNIWSEQILVVEKTIDRDAVREEWFGALAEGRRVIGWYDTTFVEAPNSPSVFAEAIRWYQDILKLADAREDLLMVMKPSKNEAYYVDDGPEQLWAVPRVGRDLMAVWAALRRHPRIRFLDHSADSTTVIAASDLTVTFCYSSVSAEALGAGRRAIWYEPGQRWRDTFFGAEPMLVAHGFSELKRLVTTLLDMSEEEYHEYLQSRVRGLVETFVDGRGLSRLRALLSNERSAAAPPTPASQAVRPA